MIGKLSLTNTPEKVFHPLPNFKLLSGHTREMSNREFMASPNLK